MVFHLRGLALGACSAFLLSSSGCTDQTPADDDTSGTDDDATPGDDDSTPPPDDDTTPDDGIPDTYRGLYVSMQLDGSGNPVVAYYDKDTTGVGIARFDGSAWVRTAPPDLGNPVSPEKAWMDSKDWGKHVSFVLSGTTWHLAFQDVTAKTLKYASSTDGGKTWTVEDADAATGGGLFASLALDSSGSPAIAHHNSTGKDLRLARRSGGSWSASVVDEGTDGVDAEGGTVSADVGQYASLAADGSDLRVAYYDAANGDLKLAAGLTGAATITTVDSAGDVGAWPALFRSGTGWVIAYHDVGAQDLKLAREAGGTFTAEVVDSGDYVGADSAVAEIGGKLSIAYFDGVQNDVKLATDTGSGWGIRALGGGASETDLAGAVGYSNNLIADATGKLHVATFRYDRGDFVYSKTSP